MVDVTHPPLIKMGIWLMSSTHPS